MCQSIVDVCFKTRKKMGDIRLCFLHHQIEFFFSYYLFIYLEKQPAKDEKTVSTFALSNDFCRIISFAFIYLILFYFILFFFFFVLKFFTYISLLFICVIRIHTRRTEEELSNDIKTEAKK